jgi:hypothetical protein
LISLSFANIFSQPEMAGKFSASEGLPQNVKSQLLFSGGILHNKRNEDDSDGCPEQLQAFPAFGCWGEHETPGFS